MTEAHSPSSTALTLGEFGFHRLDVERRILGLLAMLGIAYFAWLFAWAALVFEPSTLQASALASIPVRLGLAGLIALVGLGVHLTLRLPLLRWPRDRKGPTPWLLACFGAPSLLLWPLLSLRDRHGQAHSRQSMAKEEVELAFRELLAVPRISGAIFGVWLGSLTLVSALAVMQFSSVSTPELVMFIALSLSSLLPLISLAMSRVRMILVPELLAAPRPDPVGLPVRHSIAWRLGGPAGFALLGAVLVPVLVGALWTDRSVQHEHDAAALRSARALLAQAEIGDITSIEATILEHPDYGLHTPTQRWGSIPPLAQPGRGLVDLDGDGRLDHAVLSDPEQQSFAIVPRPTLSSSSLPASLAMLALGLIAGLAALALLLRDVERDLGRASKQVAALSRGELPEPMVTETFVTAELRGLIAAINRLVGRITDTNVYKYVLIEKGQEADRLKSQFLANMSHDLRSPLNSVLGFSELLTSGIEGELEPEQLDMVQIIHRTGRGLLQQIDDILDTAKIEAGRMELHREPTPPATLIARAIQRARLRVADHIEYDTSFGAGLPPVVIDSYRTTQALENILIFAAEGLKQGTIEVYCEAHRDRDGTRMIALRIISPRALVPVKQLEQARRGFFRLPGHTGLGLGLPIATAVIEQQGGELLMEVGASSSLAGRATMCFELRLPALSARRAVRTRIA